MKEVVTEEASKKLRENKMLVRILRLTHGKFVRNVAIVATGTAGAQAITMAFSPIITRIYGPEAFGLLGAFMAIVAIVAPISALAYPMAIVLPREDDDAIGIAWLSAYIAMGTAGILALLLFFVDDLLLEAINLQIISDYAMLIPLMMLFSGVLQLLQQWLIRKKEFGIIAKAVVLHSFMLNGSYVLFGWLLSDGAALIVLTTLASALYAATLGLFSKISYKTELDRKSFQQKIILRKLAQRHYDFPLYRAPQIFINSVSQNLPAIFFASFIGPASAGFYTLGKLVMGMPSTLVGKSVGDVLYPRITEAVHRGENLTKLILKATIILAVVGFLPFAFVFSFGPWLFGIVFGDQWHMAGEYARWLALFFFFNFINKPCVTAVPVLGIQRGLLFYEVFSTGAKVLGLLLGFFVYESDIVAVMLFSVIGVVAYAFMMFWIVINSRRFDHEKTSRKKAL